MGKPAHACYDQTRESLVNYEFVLGELDGMLDNLPANKVVIAGDMNL